MAELSISQGQYFEVGGKIYRSQKNIAPGAFSGDIPFQDKTLFAFEGEASQLLDKTSQSFDYYNKLLQGRTMITTPTLESLPTQQEQGTGAVNPLVPGQINPAGEPGFVAPTPAPVPAPVNQFAQTPNEAAGINPFAPKAPQQPASTQAFAVETGSIGPNGKPVRDIFIGNEHITNPNDPRLQGVNLETLPLGQAPQGFQSQFQPATQQPQQGTQQTQQTQQPQQGTQVSTGAPQATVQAERAEPDSVVARGNDVYVIENGIERHSGLDEFQRLGINFDFLKDGTPVPLATARTGQAPQVDGVKRVGNDFFIIENGKERHISLSEFKELGINEQFVQDGSTVSLEEARTGVEQTIREAGGDPSPDNPVKTRVEEIRTELQKLNDKFVEDVSIINDNPWLSEAERSRRTKSLQEKNDLKKGLLLEELRLFKEISDRDTALTIIDGQQVILDLDTGEIIKTLGEAPSDENLRTQITEVGGRKVLVNLNTGEVIQDLGVVSRTPTQGDIETYQNTQIEQRLIASKRGGEYVDGNVYLEERRKARVGTSEFDSRFSYLLDPNDPVKQQLITKTGTTTSSPSNSLSYEDL